jgi:predicted dehydrogenase
MSHSDVSRRRFLTVPAAAVGAAAILPAQSPNDTVRVGVIGVGNRGGFLLRQIMKVPGVQIAAICDINPENLNKAVQAAEAAGHKPETFTEFRKLLDRKDIDAVVIATPVDLHKEMFVAALEVGKHLYGEKPMGLTPEDCRMVTNAAKSSKGIFQAGFQLRHDPARAASMAHIKSGGIGKVLFLQAYRHTGDLPRQTLWYFDRTRSGDNIVEQACHIIDLMVWAAGTNPLRCFGTGGINLYKNVPEGRTTMDNYAVIYEFPNDVRFTFSHIYFDPLNFSGIHERVFGEEGAIELPTGVVYELTKTRGAGRAKNEVKLDIPNNGQDSNYLSLAAFIDNARGKKTPLNHAESARISTLTAMMGRKSIYERRAVTWDEVNV